MLSPDLTPQLDKLHAPLPTDVFRVLFNPCSTQQNHVASVEAVIHCANLSVTGAGSRQEIMSGTQPHHCHARSSSHRAIHCLAMVVIAWHALQKLALELSVARNYDGELIDVAGSDSCTCKNNKRLGIKARWKGTA